MVWRLQGAERTWLIELMLAMIREGVCCKFPFMRTVEDTEYTLLFNCSLSLFVQNLSILS